MMDKYSGKDGSMKSKLQKALKKKKKDKMKKSLAEQINFGNMKKKNK